MTSKDIRNKWMSFFEKHDHKVCDSFPLVNPKDESLLYVNAGIAPLKKYFDGSEVPDNKRIVTIQKCIRTNDIEEVGITKRHLTYFDMMGNFSIGDYFKDEAIEMAYDLLFNEFKFDNSLIYITVYPEDVITYDKWLSLGIAEDHLIKLDGNFWEIGEGPCGPCTEIFYDRGIKYGPDSDLERFKKDEEQDRFIEIWNIVFSEFNSIAGLKRSEYPKLPHQNIDTGAGLERWAVVSQDKDSVYETDLFMPIIEVMEELTGVKYSDQKEFKVIADHLRAMILILHEGVGFGNTGRSYILRRLLRRSLMMGRKLGLDGPFLYKLADITSHTLDNFYPDLSKTLAISKVLILDEENLFLKTLNIGEKKLLEKVDEAKKLNKDFSGYDAFRLYDTYGFPIELTMEYLEEHNLHLNLDEFYKYLEEARNLSKESFKGGSMNIQDQELLDFTEKSEFIREKDLIQSKVIFLKEVEDKAFVIFDKTNFYAEGGGQSSDQGFIKGDNFLGKVTHVFKAPNKQHIHEVEVLDGDISLDDVYSLEIDVKRRFNLSVNHSTTHIIHYALREYFNTPIRQAGSFIEEDYLRFDFTYTGKINDTNILNIEKLSNHLLEGDVKVSVMNKDDAIELGAIADFDEMYETMVRVVQIGKTMELCGGTHIKSVNDIKEIALLDISSIGSNTYRLVASTNNFIEEKINDVVKPMLETEKSLIEKLRRIERDAKELDINLNIELHLDEKANNSYQMLVDLKNELEYLKQETKNYEKLYEKELLKKYQSNIDEVIKLKEDKGLDFLYLEMPVPDKIVREYLDNVSDRLDNGLIVLVRKKEDGINLSIKSNSKVPAGLLMKSLTEIIGGSGGGSNTFASGGTTLEDTDDIKEKVISLMEKYL